MKQSTICFPVKDNKIYLSNKKRGFGAGFLNGYGGKRHEEDDSIEHTAVREMEEESGVKTEIKDLEKVAIISFYKEQEPVFECHIYFCRQWTGEFIESEEMAYPEIFDISNVPYDRMWDSDRVWLPLICSGQKIHATSIYDADMNKQISFEYIPLVI